MLQVIVVLSAYIHKYDTYIHTGQQQDHHPDPQNYPWFLDLLPEAVYKIIWVFHSKGELMDYK